MTYTAPEGVTIGTFTADILPASFTAPAEAGVSYKIYGTVDGVGTATSDGEPEGYKITLIVNDTPVPIYIGSSMIGTDEYVDYENGKVYKRTENLWDGKSTLNNGVGVRLGIYVEPGKSYAIINSTSRDIYRGTNDFTSRELACYAGQSVVISFSDAFYNVGFYLGGEELTYEGQITIVQSDTIPSAHIPYLQPTDPPVPFPAITISGETTITTTEILGNIELTGDWLAIMGSTEAESLDIGFTVDADEFIAFVTIDDDPQIQVTDTITMPSSADSFTLQVVSWGRERYTETVYSALS